MKLLRRILLAGASLVAMTAHAAADPIFTPIAAWLFAGPLGAVLSINAIYAGVQALFGIGLSIASSALQGGAAQQAANPGQFKNTFEAASMSEIRGVGRGRSAG